MAGTAPTGTRGRPREFVPPRVMRQKGFRENFKPAKGRTQGWPSMVRGAATSEWGDVLGDFRHEFDDKDLPVDRVASD